MANKRIQDLENVEEVLADSLIPVGEAVKTKSMLVSQLKNWLAGFFVSKAGVEAISGYKTFTNGFGIFKDTGGFQNLKNTVADITQKTTITGNTTEIRMLDKNDRIMAIFEHQQDDNGELRAIMAVRNHANNGWGEIIVGFNGNDTVYTKAPTPATNDNSTKIATTNFVNNFAAKKDLSNISTNIDYVTAQSSNYIKFKSGKLIQWGKVSQVGSSENRDVTFPIAFKTLAIGVAGGNLSAGSYEGCWGYAKSLTTMTVCNGSKGSKNDIQWIAIGY